MSEHNPATDRRVAEESARRRGHIGDFGRRFGDPRPMSFRVVEIRVGRDGQGLRSSFSASGHAGWAQSGEDVVCAAVSTLLQAAWLGLSEVAGIEVDAQRSDGELALTWPPNACGHAAVVAIVDTTALALERIAVQYPDHVRVVDAPADQTSRRLDER